MRKTRKSILGLICIGMLGIGAFSAHAYSFKTVEGFFRSDFVPGIASQGQVIINSAGIGYRLLGSISNPSYASIKRAWKEDEVVLIHSHGAPGLLTLSSFTNLTGTTLNGWTDTFSSRLVYISACQTGMTSSTYGNFPSILVSKGVGTVVAFTEEIGATTQTNGIHEFNSMAVTEMTNGYNTSQAMARAYVSFATLHPSDYYGADSYLIYGNSSYYLRYEIH